MSVRAGICVPVREVVTLSSVEMYNAFFAQAKLDHVYLSVSIFRSRKFIIADPGRSVVSGAGMRLLTFWDCGFEFRQGQECLSLVNVVWNR
jgi:hypothetical protein